MNATAWRHPILATVGIAVAALALVAFFQSRVMQLKRPPILERIDTETPLVARLVLAGGDPYLAANAATFRALIANLGVLDEFSIGLLAKLQDDASRLNPAQADNYYVAQGTLPWIGDHVGTTDRILDRAARTRRTDFMPDYFLGINAWYFRQDFSTAGRHFKEAGDKVGPPLREQMWSIAANYYDKSDNIAVGRAALKHLREAVTDPQQKVVIDARLLRLDGLEKLRDAATAFERATGRKPDALQALVDAGLIDRIPTDPIGLGYTLDAGGTPRLVIRQSKINTNRR
jgi:hypothetical protein